MRRSVSFSKSILIFSAGLALIAGSLFAWLHFSFANIKKERASASPEVTVGAYTKEEARALGQLESYFVSGGNEASFISSIETACSGLSLVCSMKTLEVLPQGSATSSIKTFRVVLSSVGQFGDVMKFLGVFENSSYPVEINAASISLRVEPTASSTWEGVFDISLPVFFKETL